MDKEKNKKKGDSVLLPYIIVCFISKTTYLVNKVKAAVLQMLKIFNEKQY